MTTTVEKTQPGRSFLKDSRVQILKVRQHENIELNNKEYGERRIILSSTPQRIFMQINAICNADCIFCSKGYDYPTFQLDDYLKVFGRQLNPVLSAARELILTGSGEFLGLPDAERILEYFNDEYPQVDKFIATNASHNRPRVWELIAESKSTYTLQISLHSTDEESHKQMMRYGSYKQVMENIRYLVGQRKKTGNPRINLMFIMTTFNVDRLCDFIRWGADLGVDKVVAGYFNIYESQQKYLSLYFKQDLANRMIDEARALADELKVDVSLPQKFGEPAHAYNKPDCCPEPWHQIMLNADGHALPCDVYGRFDEDLNKKSFQEIWNGPAYREIRKSLRKNEGCIVTCPRQNTSAINKWQSHVINRIKEPALIVREYEEAMRKP